MEKELEKRKKSKDRASTRKNYELQLHPKGWFLYTYIHRYMTMFLQNKEKRFAKLDREAE